jgi:hypothetical protein
VGGKRQALAALPLGKRPGTPWQMRELIDDFLSLNGKRMHQLMQDCNENKSPQPSTNQIIRK